ncbi:hypothetical protein K2173_014416 [Erythroxylum novogranatense]|uniref:SBP-type domain-containing protein n=1 Tax=Erythroxylum novogranatense TaxID=1862640 RepID=A0AAV8S5Z3_9ROSI|nr:hypothetical protein K2173_014416 [Erythroxylum novogranatense]
MDARAAESRRGLKEKDISRDDFVVEDDLEDDMEEEVGGSAGFVDDEKKGGVRAANGKRSTNGGVSSGGGGGGMSLPSCQVEKCGADLADSKRYHRRHKVCEVHAKAPAVVVAGVRQRFCQQCSRFHELSEFDESKRSCRRRLAGHNERRRKSSSETYAEGSGRRGAVSQFKETQWRPADDRGSSRFNITVPANPTCKRSQIR